MDLEEKASVLRCEILELLDERKKGFQRDKRKAARVRVTLTAFSATITVVVGIDPGDGLQGGQQVAALVLGAASTLVSAWDSHFDHEGLWIHQGVMLARVRTLVAEFDYAVAGTSGEELTEELLQEFRDRVTALRDRDIAGWAAIRGRKELWPEPWEQVTGRNRRNPDISSQA